MRVGDPEAMSMKPISRALLRCVLHPRGPFGRQGVLCLRSRQSAAGTGAWRTSVAARTKPPFPKQREVASRHAAAQPRRAWILGRLRVPRNYGNPSREARYADDRGGGVANVGVNERPRSACRREWSDGRARPIQRDRQVAPFPGSTLKPNQRWRHRCTTHPEEQDGPGARWFTTT